jgi:hypothetical protein
MDNAFDEMRRAVAQAKSTLQAVRENSSVMADLLVGNLRDVKWASTLRALKKELRDFDMTTGTWKS